MLRWIAAITAALTLTGCVTERVVYRDRYVDEGYADTRGYRDGGTANTRVYRDDGYDRRDRYAGSGSYYSPSYSGRGDYYYGSAGYDGYDNSPSWYWDYPAYYSVFWPMYRSWHDPYWYPNYYYGVTYYPRNYFSISFNSGWGWPRYSSFYYSPYRYAWVDNYYDWTPWHGHHAYRHNRYQTPRYGSARNEAERLSRVSDWNQRGYGAGGYNAERGVSSYGARDTAFGRYGTARSGARDADYGSQAAPRQMPAERGFGVTSGAGYGRNADVRRNAAYGEPNSAIRQQPATRGFGVPTETNPRTSAPAPRGYEGERPGATREAARYGSAPVRSADRGYDTGVTLPRRGASTGYEARRYEAPAPREYSRPAMPSRGYEVSPPPQRDDRAAPRETYESQRRYSPQVEARSYSAPSRGYDTGASAPAPRYESRAEPRFESRPEPRYESRPEPRYESRPEPSYESRPEPRESRSESDDGGVRRVGSNRDED